MPQMVAASIWSYLMIGISEYSTIPLWDEVMFTSAAEMGKIKEDALQIF